MSQNNTIPNEEVVRLAEKEEPRLLSILLRDKDCLTDAISFGIRPTQNNKPGHFLVPINSFLFAIMYKNFMKYGTLLTRSAMDSLVDMQDNITDERKASLKGHWDKVWNRHDVDREDYEMLRTNINGRYVQWQFFEIWKNGDQIIKSTSEHEEHVKGFIKDVTSIKNLDPDPYSVVMGIDEGMKKAMEHVKGRRDNPNVTDTIKTGIDGIDNIYNGFERGSYTVVSGMINGGKTTLLMNMGFNIAKMGYDVAYVSLEKKAELFFRRILALHALTDYNRIKRGGKDDWGLTDYWYGKLEAAAADIRDNVKPHYDCLQFVQKTTLTRILSEIDKIRTMRHIDVLIVDYLQVIGFETNHPNRPDLDLADIHQRLMAYGRKHNLVIFTALQLKSSSSKDIRKKSQKVATDADVTSVEVNTEDYSGSQMIIADADNALGCVLNNDHPATKMWISVSKSRDDESKGLITLDFDGKIGRVSDPEYTVDQIKATQDLLYDSNLDRNQLEEKLKSDDDLFKTMEENENKENVKPEENVKPKGNPIEDLDKEEPQIIDEDESKELPPEERIGPDLSDVDLDDDSSGNVEDMFGPD